MVRTQVRLEENQYKRLKAMAAQQSKSLSQLVREGVDRLLKEEQQQHRWQRVWQAVGTCHDPSAAVDIAEDHDQYLSEIYSENQS